MKNKLNREIAITITYIREVDEQIEKYFNLVSGYRENALEALKRLKELEKIRDDYENCLETLLGLRSRLTDNED